MEWKNPDGSLTNGVVIEDGAGNKITSFGGGSGGRSNSSIGATGAAVPTSASAVGFQNASGNLVIPNSSAGLPISDSGAAITGAAMPAGGLGMTGWLSASWSRLGAIVSALPSLVSTGAGNAARSVIADPTSGAAALVTPFHNADNQTIGGTSCGVMTGGVAQLVNAQGNLDRQRETGFDGVPASGVAAGAQQLAGPPLFTTVASGAITASGSPQQITLAAVSFTSRGVTSILQVGSELLVGAGLATQEIVYVSAINTATKQITAIFSQNHAANVAVLSFAYNQARDATISDGATPAGIAASAAYFFNATSQTVEMERSAAGELDGASGIGTAVAAEYEWNGGGPLTSAGTPSGLQYDRARNLQGKGAGGSTLNGVTSVGASSIALNAVGGLLAGQQLRLDRGLGTEESAYVSQSYTAGSLTVALQSTLAQPHGNAATVEWDIFASAGPGLNGFTPAGIGIEEEALYDPVSGKYYIERAATQDACAPQNVVLEAPGLWNGGSIDRAREVIGDGQTATGIAAVAKMLWNGTTYDRAPGSASLGAKVQINNSSTVGDSVVTGGATAAAVVTGGTSGYAVNDTVTLSDGGSTHAVLKVTSVSSGVITGVSIQTAGVVSAAPANPVSQASTSGAGVGTPTFTMTYAPIAQGLFSGVAPVNGWKVNNPNSSGNLWVSDNGTTPAANGASSFAVFPGGGQFSTEPGEKPSGSALQLLGSTIGQVFIARRW